MIFAHFIHEVTGKPLPTEKTAQAYFYYIQDNIEEYKKTKPKKRKKAYINYFELPKKHIYNLIMDDEEDASWAAAMDFSWM